MLLGFFGSELSSSYCGDDDDSTREEVGDSHEKMQVRHFAGVPSTWSISSLEQKQQRKQTQDINNQIGFPVLLAHHRVVAGKGSCSQMSFCLCSSSWGRRYLLISLERETQEPCSPPIRL